MKDNKKSISTIVAIIIIAFLIIPIFTFGLGSNKGITTGWKISPLANVHGNKYMDESVILKMDNDDVNYIGKVYAYVGDVYNAPDKKLTFTFDWSNSPEELKSDSYFPLNNKKVSVELPESGIYGWVLVDGKLNIGASYIKVSSKQSFDLKELAFVGVKEEKKKTDQDDENKKPEIIKTEKQVFASCYGGIVYDNGKKAYISAEKDKNDKKYGFSNVCDEQDAFKRSGMASLTDKENKLSGAIENLLNGKGYYVSQTENVFAVELISLGVLIFGNNSFGLSFIPFIFFIATLYLLFAFVNKLTNNPWYGLAAVVAYMLLGLPLTLGTMASGISISAFFVLAAYFFAYNFYRRTKGGRGVSQALAEMFLCGMMFTFAISVNIQALVSVVGLVALTLIPSIKGIIRLYKNYADSEGLEKEYAREKFVSLLLRVIIGTLISFVIVPFVMIMLFYAIAYPSYMGYYSDKNFFTMIFANHKNLLNGGLNNVIVSWLIGMGGEELLKQGASSAYLVANRMLVLTSFASFVTLTTLYFCMLARRIKSEKICGELIELNSAIEIIFVAVISNFVFLMLFAKSAGYGMFIYSLMFMAICPVMLFKVLKQQLNKKLFYSLLISILALIVIFFIFELPLFMNIALPEKVMPFYMWLV